MVDELALELFPPPAPSGPQTTPPAPAAGSFPAYVVWRQTRDGLTIFREIEATAVAMQLRGERRVSARMLVERARFELRIPVNNTFCTFLADELVAKHAELVPLIERRRRRHGGINARDSAIAQGPEPGGGAP